jgi:transposase
MPKLYSQDLRDRVIDAVERGEMSRRAAARRHAISESVAIKWLDGLNGMARESLSGTAATRTSKLMGRREAVRTEKTDVTLQALCDRLSAERGRHLDDEPLLSQDWRDV